MFVIIGLTKSMLNVLVEDDQNDISANFEKSLDFVQNFYENVVRA